MPLCDRVDSAYRGLPMAGRVSRLPSNHGRPCRHPRPHRCRAPRRAGCHREALRGCAGRSARGRGPRTARRGPGQGRAIRRRPGDGDRHATRLRPLHRHRGGRVVRVAARDPPLQPHRRHASRPGRHPPRDGPGRGPADARPRRQPPRDDPHSGRIGDSTRGSGNARLGHGAAGSVRSGGVGDAALAGHDLRRHGAALGPV